MYTLRMLVLATVPVQEISFNIFKVHFWVEEGVYKKSR